MTILEAALKYASMGFSVIPVQPPKKGADGKDENKKAIIKWEPFQKKAAEPELIKQWWLKWPDARIGIVCGKVSDLAVVDCDSEEAKKAVDELIPDSLTVPIAKTPRGGYHYWFKNDSKLATGTGAMPNVDIRAEGGMIIASPSAGLNGNGYRWLISPLKAAIPIIPIKLCTVLISSSSLLLSSSSLAHGDKETVHARSKLNFAEGHRDDTLWHIGHCLTKGGMAKEQMEQLLEILGLNICNPPFPMNEIKAKVSSILKRSEDGEKNLSQDVLEWICRQSGVFM